MFHLKTSEKPPVGTLVENEFILSRQIRKIENLRFASGRILLQNLKKKTNCESSMPKMFNFSDVYMFLFPVLVDENIQKRMNKY